MGRCVNSWRRADGAAGRRGARWDPHHPAANGVSCSKALPHRLRKLWVGGGGWSDTDTQRIIPNTHFPMENKERTLPESSWLCLSSHWHRNTAMSLLYPQHPKILPSQAQPLTLVTAVQPGMPLFCCPSGHSSGILA